VIEKEFIKYIRHKMKNLKKYYLLFATVSVLGISGCTSSTSLTTPRGITNIESASPHKLALYQQTMRSVAGGIQHDTQYKRITLDTPEKKAWFKNLTYRLWDRQITRFEFMDKGLALYPTHRYEFEFVIKGFANVCG
jgi:hypothetical protein